MKQYYVIHEDEVVFGPVSKIEAKLEAERLRNLAIDNKLMEWGCDLDDCSVKRRMEAAIAIGSDGDLFEVLSESEYSEFIDCDE